MTSLIQKIRTLEFVAVLAVVATTAVFAYCVLQWSGVVIVAGYWAGRMTGLCLKRSRDEQG